MTPLPGKTAAIIPAGGLSSRMKEFKPLLPIGSKTVIKATVSVFEPTPVHPIVVVGGHRASEIEAEIHQTTAIFVNNPDYKNGMLSSIQAGVRALPGDTTSFFLLPADMPAVRPQTINRLLNRSGQTDAIVLHPEFSGRIGHPPLISTRLKGEILTWHKDGGLKTLISQYNRSSEKVPVFDKGILLDMDTVEDYHAMQVHYQKQAVPDPDECRAILDMVQPENIGLFRHSRAVALLAGAICNALNQNRCSVRCDLVEAAAWLHDIGKGHPDHAEAGAGIIESFGLSSIAEIIRYHMDLEISNSDPVNEKHIVYLADKLIAKDRYAAIEKRLDQKLKIFSDNPAAKKAASKRMQMALTIQKAVEAIIGRPISSLWRTTK